MKPLRHRICEQFSKGKHENAELESTEAKQACEQKGDICDVSSIVLLGG